MQRTALFFLTLAGSTALSTAALAADPAAPLPGEIVVLATRIKGQVDAPEAPIATFDETDIAALGAASVSELLVRISPQTGSGRGRGGGPPVILVNGQRITNFREMRNYPPEAIRRVQVLPEEVALRFGFPPDARVVNLILKDNFANRRAELEYGLPTHGGFAIGKAEATLLKITGPRRLSVNGSVEHTTPLFEAERGVVQAAGAVSGVAGDPDPSAWRSLIGAATTYGLNTSWSKGLGKDGLGGALSLSDSAARTETTSYSGLDAVRLVAPGGASVIRTLGDPLRRHTGTTTLQGGAGINTLAGNWQVAATLDANRSDSTTAIDRRADTAALAAAAATGALPIAGPLPAVAGAGYDTARAATTGATGLLTVTGRPVRLPAGEVNLTLKSGYAWARIDSSDTRTQTPAARLTRGDLSLGANLAVPLTSRRESVLAGVGDLALNVSAGWNHLSDFGELSDWSAGLNWSPARALSLGASYIVNDAAPGLAQLGNPQVQTLNVPVYDPTRGETVLVTVVSGGNPALLKERQRDWKFSANWKLPIGGESNLVVEYFRNRSSDVTASFPVLSSAIERAFPGRITRDAGGRLVAIDQRPITLSEQTGSRLRWGVNLGGGIGSGGGMPGGFGSMRGGNSSSSASAGSGPGGARGGMMALMGGRGGGPGRWNLGLFHTVQFQSRALIAPGGPALDLLGGDALATGGTPRHSVEFNGGGFYKGFGLFSQGTWTAPATVRTSGVPGSADLRFGAVAKLDVNLFADLGRMPGLVKRVPLLTGTRVSLKFENLLDSRQKVTDATGAVPLSYQADYLDPRGRVITLELRKAF
ncbi:MAG: hypothetical protein RLZZ427_1227 [Pseudomonadota bacterium]